MKKEEIHLWDIKRILIGQAPTAFLLEVFVRSLVVYIAAIIVMRWMGKRMNGQLTIIELSVMVMMGAIISVAMQVPDRGILQGLLVLFLTLFFLRSLNWLSFQNSGIQKLVQGGVSTLIKDGVLQTKELSQSKISNQQVFEVLRSQKIFHLGKVKRLYLEASGKFSIYKEEADKPGLPIYPPGDNSIYDQYRAGAQSDKACTHCGLVQKSTKPFCPNCGNNKWINAIK